LVPKRIARSTSSGVTRASSRTRTQSFRSGGVEGLVARAGGADHLDERQHGRGVEEVHPDDAFGRLRRLGDLRDRERRGVRREDGRWLDDPVELGEELALDAEVLERGLDHEPARGQLAEVGDQAEACEGGVLLVLSQPAFLDAAGEVVVDRLERPLAELRLDLAADHLDAGLEADLRDPGAHGAEPDNADARDLQGARSSLHGARS
jgi:hypothetical protein